MITFDGNIHDFTHLYHADGYELILLSAGILT